MRRSPHIPRSSPHGGAFVAPLPVFRIGVAVCLSLLLTPPRASAGEGHYAAPARAWPVAPSNTRFVGPRRDARMAPRARNVSVVYEVRMPGGLDAERLELPERPLRAGERYVIEGRLARLVLLPRPWNGDRWLVRYSIEPKCAVAARGRPEPGVFEITLGEQREFVVAGRAKEVHPALHAIRIEFIPRAGARSGGVRL